MSNIDEQFRLKTRYLSKHVVDSREFRFQLNSALLDDDAYREFQGEYYRVSTLEQLELWIQKYLDNKALRKLNQAVRKSISRKKLKKLQGASVELDYETSTKLKHLCMWLGKEKKALVSKLIEDAYKNERGNIEKRNRG